MTKEDITFIEYALCNFSLKITDPKAFAKGLTDEQLDFVACFIQGINNIHKSVVDEVVERQKKGVPFKKVSVKPTYRTITNYKVPPKEILERINISRVRSGLGTLKLKHILEEPKIISYTKLTEVTGFDPEAFCEENKDAIERVSTSCKVGKLNIL